MAYAKYITIRPFEYLNKEYGRGMELVLDDADGETLVKGANVRLLNYLDPQNEADKKVIDTLSIPLDAQLEEEALSEVPAAPKNKKIISDSLE